MGPPSSGGSTVGESLNILEGFDLGALPRDEALHLYLEATRLAYADRGAYLGDPAFVDVPLAGLLSDDFAAQRRALIDRDHAATSPVPAGIPDGAPKPVADNSASATRVGSTTNMTVTDRFGNVVEHTFTIDQTGGNSMVVPGYGFLLNNELTDQLNLDGRYAGRSRQRQPGRGRQRPRSPIAPTSSCDGRPFVAVGSLGGATIIDRPADPHEPHRSRDDAPAEIGAATGLEFLPGGQVLAAAEPVRRGGGSAMVVRPAG
jgi:gamma-glutamyltranspeptidase/glutathione hydrolase